MSAVSKHAGRILEYAVIGALVGGTAWLGQLTYHNVVVHGQAEPATVRTAPVDLPVTSIAGQPASLPVDGRNLMFLVLSTECRYCEQNMPEWRRLVAEVRALGDTAPEVVVLSVSEARETERYLERHGVDVPVMLIDPSVLELLGLDGYPSTVVVDAGRALSAWSGVLDTAEHAALLAWARSAASTSLTDLPRPSGD